MTLVLCGGVILFMHVTITKNKKSLLSINRNFKKGPENDEKKRKKSEKKTKNTNTHLPMCVCDLKIK